jgi:hypothetical protein
VEALSVWNAGSSLEIGIESSAAPNGFTGIRGLSKLSLSSGMGMALLIDFVVESRVAATGADEVDLLGYPASLRGIDPLPRCSG